MTRTVRPALWWLLRVAVAAVIFAVVAFYVWRWLTPPRLFLPATLGLVLGLNQ